MQLLGNSTQFSVSAAGTISNPTTFSHTVPTDTRVILALISSHDATDTTLSGQNIASVTWNGAPLQQQFQGSMDALDPGVSRQSMSVWMGIANANNTTQNFSITFNAVDRVDALNIFVCNLQSARTTYELDDRDNSAGASPILLLNTSGFSGEHQFTSVCTNSETATFTENLGYTELADFQSGSNADDFAMAVYYSASNTDADQNVSVTNFGTRAVGYRFRVRDATQPAQSISGAVNTPTLATASGSTKRPPRVYLNTTQTKVGATELAVQSYNDAGTSLTFNDPQGTGPTGSVFLGIENTSTHFIDWQAVTVNTGPTGSGTPSITPIEAAGNALRTTVTITDVANSGETPGLGSETWNDGSSGNVITGTGFV